jgi:hypothetical protein
MNTIKKHFEIAAQAAAVLVAAALLAWTQSDGFQFFGPLSRVITPNGDGRNDYAVICFDNPAESDVEGKVYSLLGSFVADFGPQQIVMAGSGCPTGTMNKQYFIRWDGKSGGSAVRSGVYIYQVRSEGLAFKGTLVVVR